jgi:hypothetical protein
MKGVTASGNRLSPDYDSYSDGQYSNLIGRTELHMNKKDQHHKKEKIPNNQ